MHYAKIIYIIKFIINTLKMIYLSNKRLDFLASVDGKEEFRN